MQYYESQEKKSQELVVKSQSQNSHEFPQASQIQKDISIEYMSTGIRYRCCPVQAKIVKAMIAEINIEITSYEHL